MCSVELSRQFCIYLALRLRVALAVRDFAGLIHKLAEGMQWIDALEILMLVVVHERLAKGSHLVGAEESVRGCNAVIKVIVFRFIISVL